MSPDIFKFNDYREALKYKIFNSLNPSEKDILEFSKKLGFKSSRGLGMTLSGYRIPSANLIKRLSSYLNLQAIETTYIKLLIEKHHTLKSNSHIIFETLSTIDLKISQIQWAFGEKEVLNSDQMEMICNWPCFAIHQLIQTPTKMTWTTDRIALRFTQKLSIEDIQLSLQLLNKANLIQFDPLHLSWHSVQDHITTTNDIPSLAIRKFHESILTVATKSLKTEPVLNRYFKALTLKVKPDQFNCIKKKVQDFFDFLEIDFDSNQGTEVLQIAFQAFFLTNKSEEHYKQKEHL